MNRPYDQISAENLFSLPICVITEWVMDMEENHVGATIGRPPRTVYLNIIASVGEGLVSPASNGIAERHCFRRGGACVARLERYSRTSLIP